VCGSLPFGAEGRKVMEAMYDSLEKVWLEIVPNNEIDDRNVINNLVELLTGMLNFQDLDKYGSSLESLVRNYNGNINEAYGFIKGNEDPTNSL
jgi:hypothetical protein